MEAFIKSAKKLADSNDATVQESLQTFAKQCFMPATRGGRTHNAGLIRVQPTAERRRKFKVRGSGPSQQGRPTLQEEKRKTLNVTEEDEHVIHNILPKKQKTGYPHNIGLSVEEMRRPERKQ